MAISVREVQERVGFLRTHHDDYEAAHGDEDRLHVEVLRAIAEGTLIGAACAELAREALQTTQVEFPRYCA